MATSLEASTQLENTGQIELECQLVQEQLITLTTARSELLREFEQLISGSARLLLQIQEDASPASERKLHKYEAQKRLLEERLTSLETELREKAEKLAELDSKAGDYLLKVSSSGCFTEEDEELSPEGQEMLREAVLAEMINAEINAEDSLEGAVAVVDSSSDAELCSYNVKENGKLLDLDELNNISEDTVEAFFSDNIPVKPTNNSVEDEVKQIPISSDCDEKDATTFKWRQPSSELPSSEVEEAVPSSVPGKPAGSLTGTDAAAAAAAATTQENETSASKVNGVDNIVKDSITTVIEETETAAEVVEDSVVIGQVIDEAKSAQSAEVISDVASKSSIQEELKDEMSITPPSTGVQIHIEETKLTNIPTAICESRPVTENPEKDSGNVDEVLPEPEQVKESVKESQINIIPSTGDQSKVETKKETNVISVVCDFEPVVDKSEKDSTSVVVPLTESEQVNEPVEESQINNIQSTGDQSNVEENEVTNIKPILCESYPVADKTDKDSTSVEKPLPELEQVKEPQNNNTLPTGDLIYAEQTEVTNVTSVICESELVTDKVETDSNSVEKTLTESEVKEPVEESQINTSLTGNQINVEQKEVTKSEENSANKEEPLLESEQVKKLIEETETKTKEISAKIEKDSDEVLGNEASLTTMEESVLAVDISETLPEKSTSTDLTAAVAVASSVVSSSVEETVATSLVQSTLSQVIGKTEAKSAAEPLTHVSEALPDSIEGNTSETAIKVDELKSEAVTTKVEETISTEEVICKEPNITQADVENSAPSSSEVTLSVSNSENAPKKENGADKVKKSGSESPVLDQMASLASLVSDLRRVKEDMGKCMSVKEQSFVELEDQLEATKAELALVKESMEKMTNVIKQKDETCQQMEDENKCKKIDIELKMKEIQDVTNKCSMLQTEKEEVLRKMEVLEIMMTEYRTEIELLGTEKIQIEEETKQLLSAKKAAATAQAEIDSELTTENGSMVAQMNGNVNPKVEAVDVTTESTKEDESSLQPATTEVDKVIHKTDELAEEEQCVGIDKENEIESEKPTEQELESLQAAVDEISTTAPVSYETRAKDFNVQHDINEEIEILRTKVETLEKEKKESMDKLKVNNKHLKVMDKDRKHKQKECELLRSKVEKVELKMCELQGTFDVLVKAIMNERDELIREVEEKTANLTQLDATLTQIKERHEQELEKIQIQKKGIEYELEKYQSGLLFNTTSVVDSTELETAKAENEKLATLLVKKAEETQDMISKNQEVNKEMQDFVNFLKEERTHLQQDTDRAIKEKETILETFNTLQAEHTQVTDNNLTLEKTVVCLEAAQKQKDSTFDSLTLQLEDLQKQLEDLNTKNFNLTSEMYQKDEEYKEELSAREGTIQELNTTLTNNQKQSRDNYKQLQEDTAELETRLTTSLKESHALIKELEGKMKEMEDSKNKEIQALQSHITTIKESKEIIIEEKSVIYEKLLQSQSTMLRRASANKEEASTQIEDGDCSSGETAFEVSLETVSEETAITADPLPASQSEDRSPYDGQERIRALSTELESMRNNWQQDQEEKHREAMELEEKSISPNGTDFGSQEEFERLILTKEAKIRDLESKVNNLESTLVKKNGYIAELEGKLETTSEIQEVRQTVEAQVEQITQLSEDISKLKEELEQTYKECALLKNTVDELENSKQTMTEEKDSLVKEYEEKLQQAFGNVEQANADIELKKKLR